MHPHNSLLHWRLYAQCQAPGTMPTFSSHELHKLVVVDLAVTCRDTSTERGEGGTQTRGRLQAVPARLDSGTCPACARCCTGAARHAPPPPNTHTHTHAPFLSDSFRMRSISTSESMLPAKLDCRAAGVGDTERSGRTP